MNNIMINISNIFFHSTINVFKVINFFDVENPEEYLLTPTAFELIPDEDDDSARFYFIKALQVFTDKTVPCYMSMDTDERISEFVVKQTETGIVLEEMDAQEHSVIPAIASDRYGCNSELYYAKENPKIGMEILKAGLKKAHNKDAVKEDIVLLRDEIQRGRYSLTSIKTTETAIETFINAVIAQEQASQTDNVKLYEKYFYDMQSAVKYLHKMKNIDKLFPLLQSDNVNVKYYASTNLLQTAYHTEAIRALKEIRDAKGKFSMEAGFRVKVDNEE
ncbi:MAG: hypothetical protein Q4G63_05365 [Bacteroidia bacterium]|nr:hypothetical protein [Bacteroidia bacterium]